MALVMDDEARHLAHWIVEELLTARPECVLQQQAYGHFAEAYGRIGALFLGCPTVSLTERRPLSCL